jgi:molecular chaperone DnaK
MSDSDIEKAVKEAAEFEAQDKKRKEAIDARNDADAMVFQTEKAMEEAGANLDASDKAAVEEKIASLKAVLDRTANQTDISDSDIDALKAGKEELMNAAQKLFQKLYEQQAQAAGAGAQGAGPDMGGASQSGPADDVVDGDYREV